MFQKRVLRVGVEKWHGASVQGEAGVAGNGGSAGVDVLQF